MRAFILLLICGVAAAGSKPNLIFLLTDDQDSTLGALDVMPNYVSRIVQGGATASNAFVASPKVWLIEIAPNEGGRTQSLYLTF